MAKPDFSACTGCLCFAVRRAARAVTQRYDAHLRPSGLRATQFTLLVVLKNGGPQPQSRIAELLGMERTTLTRNLRPLLARGYVTYEVGEEDRRVRQIAITPAGTQTIARALPHWRKAQREIEAQLAPAALTTLAALAQPGR
ncbi:MAG TPA: MarR family winged helix-turn-helix transcriptional regulator [Polyangia bacterium]|jgi:DNA-binding MarR family transcriptional regulator|nr:MarR family winged helix-turn-helix transcriptional regulator [Polyangia bacterium]